MNVQGGGHAGKSVSHTAQSLARVTNWYGKRIFQHNERVHRPSHECLCNAHYRPPGFCSRRLGLAPYPDSYRASVNDREASFRRDSQGFEPYVRGHYAGKSVFHTARSLTRVTERYGKRIFQHKHSNF